MRLVLCLLLCLALLPRTWAAAPAADPIQPIDTVLVLGPLPIAADALFEADKAAELRRAAVMQLRRGGRPQAGATRQIFGQPLRWQPAAPEQADAAPALWVLVLDTVRYVEGRLQVEGLRNPVLWQDGLLREFKDGGFELSLPAGSHELWLLHAGRSDSESRPALSWSGKAPHDQVQARIDGMRRVSARLLTNAEVAERLAVSPDGRRIAVSFRSRDDVAGIDLHRLEIRDAASARIEQVWTGSLPDDLAWSPDGRWLALREGKQVWLRDTASGEARLLLAEHEHLGALRWHPDSGSLLFGWTKPYEAKDTRTRRLRALEDRWRTFRDQSQVYQVDIASGLVRPLTRGESSTNLLDVHADGSRLLLSQRIIDYAEPPHALWRLFELDLATLTEREIGRYRLLDDARFADEGYWLLAGPGLAQGDGNVLGDELLPNEYDGQIYRLSADGRQARSLSRDFDPAIDAMLPLASGDLLLSVSEGDRQNLYRLDPRRGRYQKIDTGLDVVEAYAVCQSARNPLLLLRGTRVDAPQQLRLIELDRGRARTLVDTAASEYAGVRLGEVHDWRFTNSDGDLIDGRYYLPPDFDPARRYPLIVYYYGGTAVVNRQFTGRYPFHLWAAKGYVVYVLQPRGAPGYGQRYSALHVNAWGEYAADDIIEGTRAFVAAHPFIDPARIGNIGASYGGFMTMYLATRTDLFAASVSHAGISSITAYWGQGWWGFGYSGIASRGSFPWNNRELYVGRSPVYSADRITTPLLLLTGDADTNVPPGESHTMYTALKLLGREVELIEVPGEDHWILDREKRYAWWDAMLAWFDRWLKDEPQWWQALYPETRPAR